MKKRPQWLQQTLPEALEKKKNEVDLWHWAFKEIVKEQDHQNFEDILNKIQEFHNKTNELNTYEDPKFQNNRFMRFFCKIWGREAEDAFIHHIFDKQLFTKFSADLTRPIQIDIYGTEDPCFQCQIKLQWLANLLSEKNNSSEVKICYYSQDNYNGPCELQSSCIKGKETIMSENYNTREGGDDNHKLYKFIFISGEDYQVARYPLMDVSVSTPSPLKRQKIKAIRK